jgi:hypothetical protein
MDIQKIAAWANVGSFGVACVALYFVLPSQHPQVAEKGAVLQGINPSIWILMMTLLVAGVLHITAAVVQRKSVHAPAPHTGASSSLVPASVPSPSTEVGRRDFVGASITPEYLVGLFKDHTSIQANKLIEPFIGKWMKVSGHLNEVLSSTPDFAQVSFSGRGLTSDLAGIYMYFRSKDSIERLAILRRGDALTIVGEIREINSVQLTLESCELEG